MDNLTAFHVYGILIREEPGGHMGIAIVGYDDPNRDRLAQARVERAGEQVRSIERGDNDRQL